MRFVLLLVALPIFTFLSRLPSNYSKQEDATNQILLVDTIIEFDISNITFDSPNFLTVEIEARSNVTGLKFGKGDIYLEYPSTVFGSNVVSNQAITLSYRDIVTTNYTITKSDHPSNPNIFIGSAVAGCSQLSPSSSLSTDFQPFMGVKIEVQDFSAIGTISLSSLQMAGNLHFIAPNSNSCRPFDKVIVPNPIEYGDMCNCTHDEDTGTWFQGGKAYTRNYQKDIYIFQLDSGQAYTNQGLPSSVVDSIAFNGFSLAKHNVLFFKPSSNELQRVTVKNQIRQDASFMFEFPAITSGNPNDWTALDWHATNDMVNIAFNDPTPDAETIQYIQDKYNLSLFHQPNSTLPTGSNSWTFIFTMDKTACACRNAIEVAKLIYEQDSAIVKFATPAKQPSADVYATNDPYYYNAWHIENSGQCVAIRNGTEEITPIAGAGINALSAWNAGFTGQNMKVAVIDQSLYDMAGPDHPGHIDIASQLIDGRNYLNEDPNDEHSNGDLDDFSRGTNPRGGRLSSAHGQMCAGVIAAIADNEEGSVGVACNSQVIPISIDVRTSVRAFQYAIEKKADVINCSWGWEDEIYEDIENEINLSRETGRDGKGTSIICSAMNNGRLIDEDNTSAPGTSPFRFIFPASLDAVIGVVASSVEDKLRVIPFTNLGSNYGEAFDIAAPGEWLLSTDLLGSAGFNASGGTIETCIEDDFLSPDYFYFGETSGAAAVVSGAVAVLLSANSCLTPDEIEDVLENTADKAGLYNYINGVSVEFGHGRVNLGAAINTVAPTSAEGIDHISNFILYPNPTHSDLWIEFSTTESKETRLILYNSVGLIVKELEGKEFFPLVSGFNRVHLNIADLPNGLYFFHLLNGSQKNVKPIIISH